MNSRDKEEWKPVEGYEGYYEVCMINSKDKGKRGERHVVKALRKYGYDARRGVQYQGSPDSPDVTGLPKTHIEVKFTEKLNVWNALAQSERDAGEDEVATVFFKRNRSKIYVAMSMENFMEMYEAWIEKKST